MPEWSLGQAQRALLGRGAIRIVACNPLQLEGMVGAECIGRTSYAGRDGCDEGTVASASRSPRYGFRGTCASSSVSMRPA